MDDIVYSVAAWRDASPGLLLLAGRASGFRLSRDGGETWVDAFASLGLQAHLPTMVVALEPAAMPVQGDGELAGKDRPISGQPGVLPSIFAGVPGGVLSSTDGGQSWHVAQLPEPPPVVSCLVISPYFLEDGVILAGTVEDGVFRSVDRGRSWSRWNFGLLDLNVLALAVSPDFAEDETLFAGTETGIFRSTNAGRAWREVDFPMDLAPVLSLAVSPGYKEDGLIFAGTEANGLFLSRDRGKTWHPAGVIFNEATVNALLIEASEQGAIRCLALTEDRLLVSRDAGQTWGEWETPLPEEINVSCADAPHGLAQAAPLLVGTVDGRVLWV